MPVMARFIVTRPKLPFLRLPLARRLHRLARLDDLLDQGSPHFGLHGAELSIIVAIKVLAAVDPRLFASRTDRERVARPNDEVRMLAALQRTDIALDAKLPGRVERDELERFLARHAAILHGLCRLMVQVAAQLVIVGVE